MTSRLDAALALAARGFKVFPIAPNAKSPPLIAGWPQKATSDPEQVKLLWVGVPDANIGIHCEGLVVVDVDVKKGGNESLELLRLVEDLPPTLTARTPTGGSHLYFRAPADIDGVPNSVAVLGAGLDVRSTGGYVVAPGSEVAAGVYAFDDAGVEIAPAPEWLVSRLGAAAPRWASPAAPVADAAGAVVDRARDWLRTAPRSLKGAGGDQTAFMVAAGLRDMGVSYAQACDLMRSEAWDHGCGWRDDKLEQKPIRSAYRYAQNEPGSRAAQPDDFPIVAGNDAGLQQSLDTSAQVPRIRNTGAATLSEFANSESRGPGYAIKGLLQRASYVEIFGAPGEGKTFVALDMAYHVAAGTAWHGRKVHAGPVLYLAYEGTGGLKKRAKALRQKYGTDEVPLYIAGAAFNLREKAGRQELGALIAALPAKPVLIVIDTFARALMGGDENSAQDVGAFNAAVAALIGSTGACVCIIHHTGKDKSKGPRGSSSLEGAIDTEIRVDGNCITATKQRDMEVGEPIGFKLVPLIVGIDEDGDDVTSCVVETAAAGPKGLERLGGNAKRGFDALCAKWPDNRLVDPLEWRDECREFLGAKSIAQRFYDIKRVLLQKGYIEVNEKGYVTRRML